MREILEDDPHLIQDEVCLICTESLLKSVCRGALGDLMFTSCISFFDHSGFFHLPNTALLLFLGLHSEPHRFGFLYFRVLGQPLV